MDERKNQIDEITEKIPEAIQKFMSDGAYQGFLRTMGKFNNRSINNCILIAMQRPDATYCEGFQAWKNKFGRSVVKGAKGIKIIQPAPYKKSVFVDKIDAAGNQIIGKDGKPEQEKVEHIVSAYKVGYVFAYEDTIGTPLPEVCHNLEASVENYDRFLEALKTISPVPIVFEKIEGGTNGYFHLETKDIHIRDDLPQLQTIKTTIHEMAHSLMHDKDSGTDKETNRREREVEAESVAFTVASYYGLDTSDYSFGYIAGWSQNIELPELKERLEAIRATAHTIISKLDKHFLVQKMNEQTEMIFKLGTDYLVVSQTDDGWSCALYDANFVRTKVGSINDSSMKMGAAITHFCSEHKFNRESLMPVNEEYTKPILLKADDVAALKKLEDKIIANPVSHIRHL